MPDIERQRLFCFRLAKHVQQYHHSANPVEDATRIWDWVQAQPDSQVAFLALESVADLRTGRMAVEQMLTLAEEAYTFAGGKAKRVAPKPAVEPRAADKPTQHVSPSSKKKASRKKGPRSTKR